MELVGYGFPSYSLMEAKVSTISISEYATYIFYTLFHRINNTFLNVTCDLMYIS